MLDFYMEANSRGIDSNLIKDFNQNLDGEIHLWSSLLDQSEEVINYFWIKLSDKEKERISKYKFKFLRDRHTVSTGLLKSLISCYLNTEVKEISFLQNGHGKPSLQPELNKLDLRFNISHSENVGVFAFSLGKELGIDVELIQKISNLNQIIDISFSDYEKKWFYKTEPEGRNELFYKIWTAKEAFVKAIGKGLSYSLKEIEFQTKADKTIEFHSTHGHQDSCGEWKIFTFNPLPNFISSLVTQTNGLRIRRYSCDDVFMLN